MKATTIGDGWLRQSEAVLGFRLLTKFPESFSIATLLVPQLIESFGSLFRTNGRLTSFLHRTIPGV